MADGKQVARQIFQQTISSIDIPRVMERKLQWEGSSLILPSGSVAVPKIFDWRVIAIGKAAHAMVDGLLSILPAGTNVTGVVSAPTAAARPLSGLRYFVGGHPIPNAESLQAGEATLNMLATCNESTVVFFLLSGGGSALVEWPLVPSMALEDVQAVNRALVTCGAPIDAMNTVRKHISAIKGGRLAAAAGSATKITLAVTDVPAGKESALASGPTVPDPTTIQDAERVIARYDLRGKLPGPLLRWLDSAKMPETPKEKDRAFAHSYFTLLLGLDDLFHAAHHAAEAHGYLTRCDNSTDDWPVEKAADCLLAQLEEWKQTNPGQRVAVIADGEVSSPVTGNGTGGRNSAFVLSCVEKIKYTKITVLSAGTDGIDGNSPAAGTVADGQSSTRAAKAGLDPAEYFQRSDAFTFFQKLGDAVITGPTGNNLRDLRILLAEP